jgi:hypothetical protein
MKKLVLSLFAVLLVAGTARAQSITVTSPAAGDFWAIGSTHDIVWTIRGTMDDRVKILLFQSGERVLEIAGRVPNSGRCPWLIPATVAPGRYTVRVRTIDSAVADNSDEFSLALPAEPAPSPAPPGPIAIAEPNGGESIVFGRPFRITWNAVSGGASGRTVDLLLLRDGRLVGVVAENLPVTQRNFEWKAGHLISGSAAADVKYKVRIRVDGTTIQDDSDRSFALVGTDRSCDFAIEDVTLADGMPLEHGVAVSSPSDPRDINNAFLVKVRWNRTAPAVAGGQHAIRARALLTEADLGSAPATPPRFSEANADGTGLITIRYPFRIAWADILRMTRGHYIPIEFSIAFSRGEFDSVPGNNTRTFDLRVIGVQPLPDFVAEIVPGTVWGEAVNAVDSRDHDLLDFRAQVRFKNLARNEVGGPSAPFPGVNYLAHVFYMDNEGRWREAYWDWQHITVPSDDWVVVNIEKIHTNHYSGESIIPVNQWKPMKFEITINDAYEDYLPEVSRDNNKAVVEFELD